MNGTAVAFKEPAPLTIDAEPDSIERAIGIATVNAIDSMAVGLIEFWESGRLSLEGKARGGAAIAAVYELQQAAPDGFDFVAVARAQALKILRARAGGQQQDFPEAPVAKIIDGVLAIVGRVEQAMAN